MNLSAASRISSSTVSIRLDRTFRHPRSSVCRPCPAKRKQITALKIATMFLLLSLQIGAAQPHISTDKVGTAQPLAAHLKRRESNDLSKLNHTKFNELQ